MAKIIRASLREWKRFQFGTTALVVLLVPTIAVFALGNLDQFKSGPLRDVLYGIFLPIGVFFFVSGIIWNVNRFVPLSFAKKAFYWFFFLMAAAYPCVLAFAPLWFGTGVQKATAIFPMLGFAIGYKVLQSIIGRGKEQSIGKTNQMEE